MVGQPIVGVEKGTERIVKISQVLETGLKCNCICYNCGGSLEAVLNTSRKKHFRHSNKNCNPTPESELHFLAKTVILNGSSLYIPGREMVAYTDPVCEVRCNDLIPDATVMIEGLPYHVEIVVTNPIDDKKYLKYKAERSRVLVINLGQDDRDLDLEILETVVLAERSNRYVLSYQDPGPVRKNETENDSWLKWAIGLGAVLGIWLLNRSSAGQPGYRKKRPFRRFR